MRPLAVGLNLHFLVERAGGAGRYARELIPALRAVEPETRLTAFVSREAPADDLDALRTLGVEVVRFPVTVTHGPPGNFALGMACQWAALPALAARRRLDVVHGLANVAPVLAPRVATVVTLLDIIWMHFPETMDAAATRGMRRTALPSARRADRVIAISHAARDDFVATLGLDPGRIDVTPLGIRAEPGGPATPEAELRGRLELGSARVVLCVAQKRAHKNLDGLVRAVAALEDGDVRLVIPGSPTPFEADLRALADDLGVRLVLPEWLSEAELEGLYGLADVFVLPSFEEGFGLPILEAMARGVPVACSDASSLPEVAGDAALLFDPRDPRDIAAAITRLMSDRALVERLVARGRQRCRELTWEATARATLASYRRALTPQTMPVPSASSSVRSTE